MGSLKASDTMDLTGRIALVTGGGTGIGLVAAKALRENGAKVYICGRRENPLVEASEKFGFHWLLMDVADKDSVRKAVEILTEKEGKLDILFNNAGMGGPSYPSLIDASVVPDQFGTGLFESTDVSEWARTFSIDVTSMFLVTNAFLDLLIAGAKTRGEGEYSSVINNVSCVVNINAPLAGYVAYLAAKAGAEKLTRVLATIYMQRQLPVRVNAISPGTFASEIMGSDQAIVDELSTRPLPGMVNPAPPRRAGREQEMGSLIVFLGSKAGDYTNGGNYFIDAGLAMVNI